MNIFAVDSNPKVAAISLCDKHIIKMTLETAQILCSLFADAPYKRTHYNHPSCKWARECVENYEWLIQHGLALAEEYTHRYGKEHKSKAVIQWCQNSNYRLLLKSNGDPTKFAQAMPDEFKNENSIAAYRNYYKNAKRHLLRYTNRFPPEWLEIKNEF